MLFDPYLCRKYVLGSRCGVEFQLKARGPLRPAAPPPRCLLAGSAAPSSQWTHVIFCSRPERRSARQRPGHSSLPPGTLRRRLTSGRLLIRTDSRRGRTQGEAQGCPRWPGARPEGHVGRLPELGDSRRQHRGAGLGPIRRGGFSGVSPHAPRSEEAVRSPPRSSTTCT